MTTQCRRRFRTAKMGRSPPLVRISVRQVKISVTRNELQHLRGDLKRMWVLVRVLIGKGF